MWRDVFIFEVLLYIIVAVVELESLPSSVYVVGAYVARVVMMLTRAGKGCFVAEGCAALAVD